MRSAGFLPNGLRKPVKWFCKIISVKSTLSGWSSAAGKAARSHAPTNGRHGQRAFFSSAASDTSIAQSSCACCTSWYATRVPARQVVSKSCGLIAKSAGIPSFLLDDGDPANARDQDRGHAVNAYVALRSEDVIRPECARPVMLLALNPSEPRQRKRRNGTVVVQLARGGVHRPRPLTATAGDKASSSTRGKARAACTQSRTGRST